MELCLFDVNLVGYLINVLFVNFIEIVKFYKFLNYEIHIQFHFELDICKLKYLF